MNRDLGLKLRIRRALWAQGFHCPLEVDLSDYDYEDQGRALRRGQLTDIDVLGIRFDPDLRPTIVVADCKSGRESEPNRLFWLRGVMDFFGADEGIFVKSELHAQARSLGPKLGIRVLDDGGLRVLEESLGAADIRVGVADAALDGRLRALWGIAVPKGQQPGERQLALKEVYHFLQYRYWGVEGYRHIQMLIELFSQVAGDLGAGDERAVYLVHVGLERLVLAVLRMASAIAARGFTDIPRQARLYLFGGPQSYRDRAEMIRLLEEFRTLNQLGGMPLTLLPAYFEELVEIVNRALVNAPHAARMPAHLDAILLDCAFGGGGALPDLLGTRYSTDALVLLKRIAALFQSSAGFDRALLDTVWPL